MSRQGICVFSHYGVGQHFGYSDLNNIRCLFSQLLFCRDKKTSLVFCFFFPPWARSVLLDYQYDASHL